LLATGYLSTNGSCPLRDSFVYDSGATIHICNRRDRFVDFRVANDPILVGDTEALVKGYGTVVIWADSVMEGKKVRMTLTDTAFAPNFHTSLVSADIGFQKGIHWETQQQVLTVNGTPFCKVARHHGLWTLEYNLVQSSSDESSQGDVDSNYTVDNSATSGESVDETMVFHTKVRRSAEPQSTTATYALLHRRFAHLNEEAIAHLPVNAHGIQILDKPARDRDTGGRRKCEVCEVSKA